MSNIDTFQHSRDKGLAINFRDSFIKEKIILTNATTFNQRKEIILSSCKINSSILAIQETFTDCKL